MSENHKNIEKRAKEAFQAEDFKAVTTIFLQHYRNDIYTFLIGRLHSETDAAEVLSQFEEDFWRGLPDFQWRSTLRSWAYKLALNAAFRYRRDPHRKPQRQLPLSQYCQLSEFIVQPRSETKKYKRTEVKNKIRELREQLSDDERTLLVLRVDKGMSWRELAVVMLGEGETFNEAEIGRWSTLLRQRYTKVKAKLKELASAEGS